MAKIAIRPARKAPTYQIIVGTSFGSSDDAAAQAQQRLNGSAGVPIGIAADALTVEYEGTTKQHQWDVYVLVRL